MARITQRNGRPTLGKDALANAQALDVLATLQPHQILSVYSGKPGCCCGCLGKHTYNPQHQTLGTEKRGYTVTDEECSARSIAIMLGKAKANAAHVLYDGGLRAPHLYWETETRTCILYLLHDYVMPSTQNADRVAMLQNMPNLIEQ